MWLYHYQVYTKILFINNDMLFLIVRNAIKIQVVVTWEGQKLWKS